MDLVNKNEFVVSGKLLNINPVSEKFIILNISISENKYISVICFDMDLIDKLAVVSINSFIEVKGFISRFLNKRTNKPETSLIVKSYSVLEQASLNDVKEDNRQEEINWFENNFEK